MMLQMIEVSAIDTVIGNRNEARKISMKRAGRRTIRARHKAQKICSGLMIRLNSKVTLMVSQKAGSPNNSA